MMKPIYIIITCLSLFICTGNIAAQITVGAKKDPAPFSALQLEGNGGLRLPQVSAINRGQIDVSSSSAIGLWIYNSSLMNGNYWDGIKWNNFQEPAIIRNGLTVLPDQKMGLGGDLSKNTVLNLNGNNFKILTGNSSFWIGSSLLKITNNHIALQPAGFNVNNLMNYTSGASNNIDFYNKFSLISDTNSSNTLKVTNNNVTITGNFNYKDGKQDNEKVLISDAQGKGYWANLRPNTQYKEGVLKTTQQITNTSTGSNVVYVDITQTTLKLPAGKWIIFASYVTKCEYTSSSGDYNKRYVWTALKSKPTNDPSASYADVTVSGASTSMGTNRRSFAQLAFPVDIETETEFKIESGTRNRSVSLDSSLGEFKFYAISIILPGE